MFYRLVKCGIQDIFNLCVLNGNYLSTVDSILFEQFNSLIKVFVTQWNKQEEQKEVKRKESESLYKMR